MKILFVSTLKRRLGPDITASRLRIIYQIVEGMVKNGHQVSIIGTADSYVPGAEIIPVINKSFVEMPQAENSVYQEYSYMVKLIKKLEEISKDYDIIHNHTYPEFIALLANINCPMVTTVHAQAIPELDDAFSFFPDANLISISSAHMNSFRKAHINKVIYNGIDTNLYSFMENKDDYLLWIGRLSKARREDGEFMDPKGIRWAIKLAEETGSNLILSGNVEDRKFYDEEVQPHLSENIKWYGPISSEQALKREEVIGLMQKAKAFLMTINWEEPFGLVMAEAMSCGTPVIAFRRGSVPELIIDGKTGFIVDPGSGVEGLKDALSKISSIRSDDCRQHVIDNFSLEKMIQDYESTYKSLVA